jgi:ParB family chromosome partitioning protein
MTNDHPNPAPAAERVDLDPRSLLLDRNIRTDARLDPDFVASIRELGVLVPLIAVRTPTGEVRVRFGHRRTLAAIKAGLDTVPVEVVGDEAADAAGHIERILAQHAENAHRAALSPSETVEVVAQLSAFGVKAGEITKKTRIAKQDVKAALAIAKSDVARDTANRLHISLGQAAVIAEFEDDPEAVEELIDRAERNWGFDRRADALRRTRAEKARQAAAAAAFTNETGVPVIERPRWGATEGPVRLSELAHDGEQLTSEPHASCPGHAAFLEDDWQLKGGVDEASDEADDDDDNYQQVWEPVYVCTDPQANGHEVTRPARAGRGAPLSEEQKDQQKAERKKVLANNKAWRTAETVRREWLTAFLARKTAPKGTLRYLLVELADGGYQLREGMQSQHGLARVLLGLPEPKPEWTRDQGEGDELADALATATDARAQVIALGLVLGAYEATLGVHTWRNPSERDGRYLAKLAEWGHELSEVEQVVADRATAGVPDGDDVARCRSCGCAEDDACAGGCSWVPDPDGPGPICSSCAPRVHGS